MMSGSASDLLVEIIYIFITPPNKSRLIITHNSFILNPRKGHNLQVQFQGSFIMKFGSLIMKNRILNLRTYNVGISKLYYR